ncbi:hypothetical protein VNO77_43423 [Canavalia gladiata]|uniref:OVATE domain-containing protein n=1 Tax=Canavalia gladiata TaxID=3824 RepID=A0AAN9JUT3_CANGL
MSSLLLSVFRSRRKSKDKRKVSLLVEDKCKIFENYLVEMIVEEGKMQDLMDVEELLYCWKNIKCPVFSDLVCGFYVQICNDLFSSATEEGSSIPADASDYALLHKA